MRYVAAMRDILVSLKLENQKDFVFDCKTLEEFDSPKAKWLWMVEKFGTNLFRIGVHEKESFWGRTEVNKADHVYLFEDGRITPVSKEQAFDLLREHEYSVRNGMLFRGDELLADVVLEPQSTQSSYKKFLVRFLPVKSLSLDELTSLHYIAIGECVNKSATVFCGADIYVDRIPLVQYIKNVRTTEEFSLAQTQEENYTERIEFRDEDAIIPSQNL